MREDIPNVNEGLAGRQYMRALASHEIAERSQAGVEHWLQGRSDDPSRVDGDQVDLPICRQSLDEVPCGPVPPNHHTHKPITRGEHHAALKSVSSSDSRLL